jgi:hypothetical protein
VVDRVKMGGNRCSCSDRTDRLGRGEASKRTRSCLFREDWVTFDEVRVEF